MCPCHSDWVLPKARKLAEWKWIDVREGDFEGTSGHPVAYVTTNGRNDGYIDIENERATDTYFDQVGQADLDGEFATTSALRAKHRIPSSKMEVDGVKFRIPEKKIHLDFLSKIASMKELREHGGVDIDKKFSADELKEKFPKGVGVGMLQKQTMVYEDKRLGEMSKDELEVVMGLSVTRVEKEKVEVLEWMRENPELLAQFEEFRKGKIGM